MKTKLLILALVLALPPVVAGPALANGGVALPRWVMGGGASRAAAEGASLHATLGQPLVGVASGSGAAGDVTVRQGFWSRAAEYQVYLPQIVRTS